MCWKAHGGWGPLLAQGRVTEPRPCPRISHSQPQKNARVQTAPASEQPFGSRFNFLYSAKISAYVCRFFLMSSFIYPPPSTPCSLDFFVWRFLLSTKLLCSPLWCCYPFLANIFVLERISIHGRSCAVEALMHVHGSLLQKKHNIWVLLPCRTSWPRPQLVVPMLRSKTLSPTHCGVFVRAKRLNQTSAGKRGRVVTITRSGMGSTSDYHRTNPAPTFTSTPSHHENIIGRRVGWGGAGGPFLFPAHFHCPHCFLCLRPRFFPPCFLL